MKDIEQPKNYFCVVNGEKKYCASQKNRFPKLIDRSEATVP